MSVRSAKKKIGRLLGLNPIRDIPYFFKKKMRRNLLLTKSGDYKLRELADNGIFNYKGTIDTEILDKWIDIYGLNISNLTPSEGNLAIPFFNGDVLKLLTESPFASLLDKYFWHVYGTEPVLQCIPQLVITYPNIVHEKFEVKTHNFPANWHTDYLSEFTVHLPLADINSSNTHTMYAKNTHTSFFKPPRNQDNIKKILRSYGKKTDAIMLDVDGWHSGRLEGSNPRIMIQFKFTQGNDMLHFPEGGLSEKQLQQIERTKRCIGDYGSISRRLESDLSFINSAGSLGSRLAIINDNSKYYQHYIS